MKTYSIGELDKNLSIPTQISEQGLIFTDAREKCFSLHGVFYDETEKSYLRMPCAAAASISSGVAALNYHTAGGRLRFTTDSPYIAIKYETNHSGLMPHMTLLGSSGFDLYIDGENTSDYCGSFMPPQNMKTGYESVLHLSDDKSEHSVTLNFPLYNSVSRLYIGLKSGSCVSAAFPYRKAAPIVYYGSSITQGGCASRPGNCYQAYISRRFNRDYINLGFSGNAKGEAAMSDYIKGLDMSALVLDYDHNAADAERLQSTHEPFFCNIRSALPRLPIVIISKPDFSKNRQESIKRREVIRATYEHAVSEGDRNICFIDGETLFGNDCADSCTVDGTHPNDLGFFRMAKLIGNVLADITEF